MVGNIGELNPRLSCATIPLNGGLFMESKRNELEFCLSREIADLGRLMQKQQKIDEEVAAVKFRVKALETKQ